MFTSEETGAKRIEAKKTVVGFSPDVMCVLNCYSELLLIDRFSLFSLGVLLRMNCPSLTALM
jgi:hypothetical protein